MLCDVHHICKMMMNMLAFAIFLLTVTSHVVEFSHCVCYTSISDLILQRHVISSFSTADLNDCWQRCRHEPQCQSLNFYMNQNLCEINNRTLELAKRDAAQTPYTAYFGNPYRIAVGTVKELPAVSCAEILKTVGDVSGRYWLVDHARSSTPFMVYCNMTTIATQDCAVGQCKNGGTCTYFGLGKYQCACPNGYYGKDCENRVSICASSPCLNGGTCVDLGVMYLCDCLYNFIGVTCETACLSTPALGMESKAIPDSHITTSSNYNAAHGGDQARLNNNKGTGGWVPKTKAVGQWIQVDIGIVTIITGIATQGRALDDYWVTSYSIKHSRDGIVFIDYMKGKVFKANQDRNTIVRNNFSPSISTRIIKLVVQSWREDISLRMEIYGCLKK